MNTDSQRLFFGGKKPATSHCFDFARRSVRAAEIQIERIWDRPGLPADHPQFVAAAQDALIDVHFYFIALRNLYRFLDKVVADPVFAHLQPELQRLNEAWFKHYAKGREAFEHIDQRLPGEKHEKQLVEVTEGGASRKIHYGLSMRRGVFEHSNLTFDISKQTFGHLRTDVNAFLAKVVESCPPDPLEQIRAVQRLKRVDRHGRPISRLRRPTVRRSSPA